VEGFWKGFQMERVRIVSFAMQIRSDHLIMKVIRSIFKNYIFLDFFQNVVLNFFVIRSIFKNCIFCWIFFQNYSLCPIK
jgi:hypothetical protein